MVLIFVTVDTILIKKAFELSIRLSSNCSPLSLRSSKGKEAKNLLLRRESFENIEMSKLLYNSVVSALNCSTTITPILVANARIRTNATTKVRTIEMVFGIRTL
ncbi:MAG: hypothetical protein BWY74_03683 [Firmicutes bacterium ADurb.Bin419]|nr:MAG: hypothetical protein BWY74_03683 [Firmicutes bacterium ADurb.Bin419]